MNIYIDFISLKQKKTKSNQNQTENQMVPKYLNTIYILKILIIFILK